MEIIERINAFANSIETDKAEIVRGVASSLIATAQYVGSQGYWVANTRCWSNCYRQKRAKSPSKNAQDVWTECQEEYQKHIENDNQDWMRYAGSQDVVKTSSLVKRYLNAKIQTTVTDGIDIGSAVFSSLESNKTEMQSSLTIAAVEMAKLAVSLNAEEAEEATNISAELLKEAGLWDSFKDYGKEFGQSVKNIGNGVRTGGQLRGMVRDVKSQWQNIVSSVPKLNATFETMSQTLNAKLPKVQGEALQLTQNALQVIAQAKKYRINDSVMKTMSGILTNLQRVIDREELVEQKNGTPPNAGASKPTSPGTPAPGATPPAPTPSAIPGSAPGAVTPPSASGATPPKPSVSPDTMWKNISNEERNALLQEFAPKKAAKSFYSLKTAAPRARPTGKHLNLGIPQSAPGTAPGATPGTAPSVAPSVPLAAPIPPNPQTPQPQIPPKAPVTPQSVAPKQKQVKPKPVGAPGATVTPPGATPPPAVTAPGATPPPAVTPPPAATAPGATPPPAASPATTPSPVSQPTKPQAQLSGIPEVDSLLAQIPEEGERAALLQRFMSRLKEVHDKVTRQPVAASRTIYTLSKRS